MSARLDLMTRKAHDLTEQQCACTQNTYLIANKKTMTELRDPQAACETREGMKLLGRSPPKNCKNDLDDQT